MALLIITITLFLFYGILIIFYWQSWKAVPLFLPGNEVPKTKISIIVPARNEAAHIGTLLQSLLHQNYPAELFEIIVVDDHSEDDTVSIVKQFPSVHLLTMGNNTTRAFKKKAIETGIASACGNLIVTTDADCIAPENWLRTIDRFKQFTGAVCIVAPVQLQAPSPRTNQGFLSVFQKLDFIVLQGITGASVYKNIHAMCNGANLAYERSAFYAVDGFSHIDHIASGDDMLLLHKIAQRYPGTVAYLKSVGAIVTTSPASSWKGFFNQRLRWASKAVKYDDKSIVVVLLLVYLFNCCFLVLLAAGFVDHRYWMYAIAYWIMKTIVEIPLCMAAARFFRQQKLVPYFFFLQPVHILYTVVIGLLGQFGKYEWKGRKLK